MADYNEKQKAASLLTSTGQPGKQPRNHVESMIPTLVPAGAIILWSGAQIPTGWAICDGNNGTPKLHDPWVMSAQKNSFMMANVPCAGMPGQPPFWISRLKSENSQSNPHGESDDAIFFHPITYIMKLPEIIFSSSSE
jgi:hypothetical protein